MDPLTAVGLAGTVAQLIEISWKIVSKTNELRKHGSLPEHRDMQIVTDDLGRINGKVMSYLQKADAYRAANDDDNDALWRLCESSNEIADQLIIKLRLCEVERGQNSWKSLRQALKTVWLKSELDDAAARLHNYRTQLNTRILVLVREEVSQISQTAENIMRSMAEMRTFIGKSQEILQQYLTDHITSETSKIQHMIGFLPRGDAFMGSFVQSNPVSLGLPPSYTATQTTEKGDPPHISILQAVREANLDKVRLLLRMEPSAIRAFDASGQTVLHIAATLGDVDLLEYLIRRGAEINPDDNEGRLPLHCAVSSGSAAVVHALVARAADVSAKDKKGRSAKDLSTPGSLMQWILIHGSSLELMNKDGQTALSYFASRDNLDAVRTLLDLGADIEKVNKHGRTPLLEATEANKFDAVKLLLSSGANMEARDSRKATSLITASLNGFTEIGKMLLDRGADIRAVNMHQYSALQETCRHGRIDMGLALIEAGSDCVQPNDVGYTPLHVCAQRGHLALLRAIFDKNPKLDVNMRAKYKWRPLDEASEHGHKAVVDFLLERGADPNRQGGGDNTYPLHRAAWNGHPGVAEQLLKYGADPSHADGIGYTALHQACRRGHLRIVQLLLRQKKVNINATQADKWTPLHEATWHGHADIVKALLDHGAARDVVNGAGATPLSFAAVTKRTDIVMLLAAT